MDAPIIEQIPVAVSPTNPSWRVRWVGWVIQDSKAENRENLIWFYAFLQGVKFSQSEGLDDR
jgi:hypothetical protein